MEEKNLGSERGKHLMRWKKADCIRRENGDTYIEEAVGTGLIDNVRRAFKFGAKVNSVETRRALVDAAEEGQVQIVRFMLDRGVSVNAKNEHGETLLSVLMHAISNRERRVRLKEEDAKLLDSERDQADQIIELVLQQGPQEMYCQRQSCSFVMVAILSGLYRTVKWYLPREVCINRHLPPTGSTILIAALSMAELEMFYHVYVLIQSIPGFNVDANDAYGRSALHHACAMGSLEIVMFLVLHAEANVVHVVEKPGGTEDGETCLHLAVRHGHLSVIQWLLENTKIQVNQVARHPGKSTALSLAVDTNSPDIVGLLMEHKADPRHPLYPSCNVAYTAAILGYLTVLQRLYDKKVCMGQVIVAAARTGQLEVVQWLWSHTAQLCPPRVLHATIQFNQPHVMRWLLDQGASTTSINSQTKQNALEYAQEKQLAYAVAWIQHPHQRSIPLCQGPGCKQLGLKGCCSRCQVVFYCSSDCQSMAWDKHRRDCITKSTI
jgi:Ankyrin repeats (3 copies)/MYND finger